MAGGTLRGPAYIGVIGAGDAVGELYDKAEQLGALVAMSGAVLVSGGLGGVMEASCKGAAAHGGMTLGFLPGGSRSQANQYVQIAVPTGMGEERNHLVVRASDGLIALGGGFGTLSEIGLALKLSKPLVGLSTWNVTMQGAAADIPTAVDPPGALETLMKLLEESFSRS